MIMHYFTKQSLSETYQFSVLQRSSQGPDLKPLGCRTGDSQHEIDLKNLQSTWIRILDECVEHILESSRGCFESIERPWPKLV